MLPRPPSSTLFPYTTLFRSARQQRLPRQRARLEHQVRDADLGHALVGTDRAPGRPAVGAPRRVGVVEIALENARADELVAFGRHALAVEGPAGQAFGETRIVGDGDDFRRHRLADLTGEQ